LAGSVNSCIEVNVDFSEIVVVDDCLEVDWLGEKNLGFVNGEDDSNLKNRILFLYHNSQ
jgi:hypothetical protein